CCGNLAEAEVMIDAGVHNVLATREIVSPEQIARVAQLAKRSAALSVLTTVISRPNRTRVTTDAGRKKQSQDVGLPEAREVERLRLVDLNEEHALLDLIDDAYDLRVGDKIEIVPCNGGTTINLYDQMYGMRGDQVETIFDVTARGT